MRRGGRVVEGARLESVLWVTPYEGSNPFPSAIFLLKIVSSFSSVIGLIKLSSAYFCVRNPHFYSISSLEDDFEMK